MILSISSPPDWLAPGPAEDNDEVPCGKYSPPSILAAGVKGGSLLFLGLMRTGSPVDADDGVAVGVVLGCEAEVEYTMGTEW